jgi:5-formyltetrahydrofolate cyclo-ligase
VNELSEIKEQKARLRAATVAAVNLLTIEERALAAARACTRLAGTREWLHARSVLGFAPMSQEINIWPVLVEALSRGVQLALPRYERQTKTYTVCAVNDLKDLESGYFGIREPGAQCGKLETKLLDLILVPGVAFDVKGRRLGRGKGFYDRLLKAWHGATCGVAYDEQIVAEVPVESHDEKLDYILTPTRFIQTRG